MKKHTVKMSRYVVGVGLLAFPLVGFSAGWYEIINSNIQGPIWQTEWYDHDNDPNTPNIRRWVPGTKEASCSQALAEANHSSTLEHYRSMWSSMASPDGYDIRVVPADECTVRYPLGEDDPSQSNYSRIYISVQVYSCNPNYPYNPFVTEGSCEEEDEEPPALMCHERDPYDGTLGPVWFNSEYGEYEANYDGCAWYQGSPVVACNNQSDGVYCSSTWIAYGEAVSNPPVLECDDEWGECDDDTGGDDGGDGGDPGDGGDGGDTGTPPGGDDGGNGGDGGSDGGSGGSGGDGGSGGGDGGSGGSVTIDPGAIGEAVGASVRDSLTEDGFSDPSAYFDRDGLDEGTDSVLSAFDGLIDRVTGLIEGEGDNELPLDETLTQEFTHDGALRPTIPEHQCTDIVFGAGQVYEFSIECDRIETFRHIFGWILYFWTFVTLYDLFVGAMRPRANG